MKNTELERRVIVKMVTRVVSLLFVLYAFFSLDRGNVGLAAIEMNVDLRLSATVYGLGASIFTLSYLVSQIPITTAMRRVGAARGICCVAVSWGLVSMLTAFVWNDASFLAVRFLLGIAEAGFGSFIIYYIGEIFPRRIRGLTISLTLAAVPVTMMIASPISGVLLDWTHFGLRGWQWLFLVEGAPAVLLGVACFFLLPDHASQIRFLDDEERAWLVTETISTAKEKERANLASLRQVVASGEVWVLGLTLFGIVVGTNTLLFWMPQMIKLLSSGDNVLVGWLNAIPWLSFAAGMLLMGRLSDRMGNRVFSLSLAMLLAVAGFILGGAAGPAGWQFAGLVIGAFGVGAAMSLFWTVPLEFLGGTGLASAIAAINVIGNSSGVFAHALIGWLREITGGFGSTLLALAATQLIAVILLNAFVRVENKSVIEN